MIGLPDRCPTPGTSWQYSPVGDAKLNVGDSVPRPERVAVVKVAQNVAAKAKIIAAHLIDPIGPLLFSVLALIAGFESDLVRLRTGGHEGRQSRWAAPRVGTEAQRYPGDTPGRV